MPRLGVRFVSLLCVLTPLSQPATARARSKPMTATLYVSDPHVRRSEPVTKALEQALAREHRLSFQPVKQLLPETKDFDPNWFLGTAVSEAITEAVTDAPPVALRMTAHQLKRRIVIVAGAERQHDQMIVRLYAYDADRNRTASRSKVTISATRPGRGLERAVHSIVPLLSLRAGPGLRTKRTDWYQWAMGSPYVQTLMKATAAMINTRYNPYYKVFLGARFRQKRKGGFHFLPIVKAY